ncbi:hypothetical protein CYMTET_41986 [Cymbomonas tetramitiformis]|uniref:Cyclic nucleotide-binding domain-containing protein n=1 Tax=Cymbomonas tetramitiformis TaxID=36881 RepID=A0AAE0C641_9CHLO|nr:hypothetical protein CYMTET_41986 [Cymbomonas tetramitiformis]
MESSYLSLVTFCDQFTDLILLVGVVLKIFYGRHEDGIFITSQGHKARQRNLVDIMTDLLCLTSFPERIVPNTYIPRLARTLVVIKLPAVLDLLGQTLLEEYKMNYVGVFRMTWWTFYTSHLVGLSWLKCSHQSGFGSSPWVAPHELMEASIRHQYAHALFWGFDNLSSNGSAEPSHEFEVWFQLLVSFLGTLIFAQVVAELQNLLAFQRSNREVMQEKRGAMLRTLNEHKVPSDIQMRVKGLLDLLAQSQEDRMKIDKEMEVKETLDSFPDDLRDTLITYFNAGFISKMPFFNNLNDEVITRLWKVMRPQVNEPGSTIIQEGQKGNEMYFLLSGTVTVSRGQTIVGQLDRGSYFGELAIVFPETTRTATIQAKMYCALSKLNKLDFDRVMVDYPDYEGRIIAQAVTQFQKVYTLNLPHLPGHHIPAEEMTLVLGALRQMPIFQEAMSSVLDGGSDVSWPLSVPAP